MHYFLYFKNVAEFQKQPKCFLLICISINKADGSRDGTCLWKKIVIIRRTQGKEHFQDFSTRKGTFLAMQHCGWGRAHPGLLRDKILLIHWPSNRIGFPLRKWSALRIHRGQNKDFRVQRQRCEIQFLRFCVCCYQICYGEHFYGRTIILPNHWRSNKGEERNIGNSCYLLYGENFINYQFNIHNSS